MSAKLPCNRSDNSDETEEPSEDDILNRVADRIGPKLSAADFAIWKKQARMVARLGNAALLDLVDVSVAALHRFGAEPTLHVGQICLHIEELSGGENARHFLRNGRAAVYSAPNAAAFSEYLDCLVMVARQMPLVLKPLVESQVNILPDLEAHNLKNWIGTGLAIASWDPEHAIGYFELRTDDARRLLGQMSGEVDFDAVAPRLRSYIRALWNISPVCVSFVPDETRPNLQRSSYFHSLVRMPSKYPSNSGKKAVDQFRGALAHVAAHLAYGYGPEEVGALKPVQVALISLIEDARVEQLACAEFAGLARLWANLHSVTPGQTTTVNKLLARLSRALADPHYDDDNPWVRKGRQMFFDGRAKWNDAGFSRHLGGLLGNDLGQMRIPFNARSYVVEPSYRDDNAGLWIQEPDDTDPDQTETEVAVAPSENRSEPTETVQVTTSQSQETRVELGQYWEWDYAASAYRQGWCKVNAYEVVPAPISVVEAVLATSQRVVLQVEKMLLSTRVGQSRRLRGQPQGDVVDIEACIRYVSEKRAGKTPDPRIYQTRQIPGRELSVFVLLDISQSTRNRVGQSSDTILSLERKAASVLGLAMQRVGDAFGMAGFCSDGRNDVRMYPVKGFSEPFDIGSLSRLNGLRGGLSTRLGAALRNCGDRLSAQKSDRKLLLVITDGEPADRDITDSRYLIEDARQAVSELRQKGVDTFAVALGSDGVDSLPRIFSRRNYQVIDKVEQLPARLTRLYHQLAK